MYGIALRSCVSSEALQIYFKGLLCLRDFSVAPQERHRYIDIALSMTHSVPLRGDPHCPPKSVCTIIYIMQWECICFFAKERSYEHFFTSKYALFHWVYLSPIKPSNLMAQKYTHESIIHFKVPQVCELRTRHPHWCRENCTADTSAPVRSWQTHCPGAGTCLHRCPNNQQHSLSGIPLLTPGSGWQLSLHACTAGCAHGQRSRLALPVEINHLWKAVSILSTSTPGKRNDLYSLV